MRFDGLVRLFDGQAGNAHRSVREAKVDRTVGIDEVDAGDRLSRFGLPDLDLQAVERLDVIRRPRTTRSVSTNNTSGGSTTYGGIETFSISRHRAAVGHRGLELWQTGLQLASGARQRLAAGRKQTSPQDPQNGKSSSLALSCHVRTP